MHLYLRLTFFLRLLSAGRFRLGLRSKIVTLGIAGAVIAGGISLAGLHIASRVQDDSAASVALRLAVTRLSESYLEAGQIADEFLRKHDDSRIKTHAETLARAADDLATIEATIAPLPADDPLKAAAMLRPGINQYAVRFQNVVSAQRVLGLKPEQGLFGKLGAAARALEARLAPLDMPALTVEMLAMRRDEKDFLLSGNEKFGDTLKTHVETFQSKLGGAALPDDVKAELTKLLQAYDGAFTAVLVSQGSLTEEIDDLATLYGRNRPALVAALNAADARYQAAERSAQQLRQTLIWTIALATLVTGLAIFLVANRVAGAIARLARAMQQLAAGDLSIVLPGLGRHDEIGDMAQAVEGFKAHVAAQAQREAAAKAEQDHRVATQRRSEMQMLADGFERTVGDVIDTMSHAADGLEASADTLTHNADRTRKLSATVATASTQASDNVRSVAAATEEMSSSVGEIGRQVGESTRIAAEAVRQADDTNARIGEMARAAERIGDVVKLISAIAQQTNLLALNATIEAARAGDAGRGFAVVASEVKQLASQTANATGDITQQITALQTTTRDSVTAIEAIGGSIGRMSDIATSIAAAVQQQGAATQEIARNVQQATTGTADVAVHIADVTRGAGETGTASAQVHASAQSLAQQSQRLKSEVQNFLSTVRAA